MAKSPDKFHIIYRGEMLTYYKPGEWFSFSEPKRTAAVTGFVSLDGAVAFEAASRVAGMTRKALRSTRSPCISEYADSTILGISIRNFHHKKMTNPVHLKKQRKLYENYNRGKIMEEVRPLGLPTRLKNNPLVGVVFELRFTSSLPLTNILPGIIFSELGCSDIEKTPHAEIPESIKLQNEALAHLPTVKMLWNDYLILMGDRVLVVECRLPYKGWNDFKEKILKLLNVVKESRMDINVNRYSLKYIDIVSASEHEKINNTLKLSFSFGGADLNLASTQIRTETTINDAAVIINLAGTARADFEDGGSREGFLLDTDTLYNINGNKLEELLPDFPNKLTELHDINKGLFFSYLTDAGLAELEPEYD